MRKAYENRAENYIKKHLRHKKWIAFVLCIAMLTGSITLYMLNKPAAAMTEEGAQSIGVVLDTADDDFEAELIEEMNNKEEEVSEVANDGEGGDDVTDEGGNAPVENGENGDGNNNENAENLSASSDGNDSAATDVTSEKKDGEKEEVVSDSASTATTEASSDASSMASSAMSTDASTAASSTESSIEDLKDVVIKELYVDSHDKEIAESKELSINESLEIKKEEVEEFDGYFFSKALIDDEEIVKIAKKTKEASVSKADEENEDSASLLTDKEGEVAEYSYYEATTKEGKKLEITEDAELRFVYNAANTQKEFVYKNGEITVKAVLSKPEMFPEGIELSVTDVEPTTSGYNYSAYLDALNNNADAIAEKRGEEEAVEYTQENTVLFDIAFILDEVEYDPTEGTVAVSIEYNDNRISSDLEAENAEDISIVHLPLAEGVKENYDKTSDATNITASQIDFELIDNGSVKLGDSSDVVSFQTSSFCVYAYVKCDNGHTWKGTDKYSAGDIIGMLGDSTYFGVVGNDYDGCKNHSEANIAVRNIYNVDNYSLGNSANVYQHLGKYTVTVNKVVNGPRKAGTFYFAVFSDPEGKSKINGSDFSITTGADGTGSYTFDFSKVCKNAARGYVLELDKQGGNAIKNDGQFGSYTVSYGGNGFTGVSDGMACYSDNYVENLNGHDPKMILQHIDGNTVYFKSGSTYKSVTEVKTNQYVENTYTGDFPINIGAMLSQARDASSKIANAASTGDVEVANIIATDGRSLRYDLSKYYLGGDENVAVNSGIDIGDKLLVINVDLSNARTYKLDKIKVNGKGTGDWSEVANQIVINLINRNGCGVSTYSGSITADILSGTLIAPDAHITTTGSYSGTIIANKVTKQCEIHKIVIRKHLDMQASLTITNTDAAIIPVELGARKLVNGQTPTDEEIFSFTLRKYSKDKGWETVADDIQNIGESIKYAIEDPAELGIEAKNDYYFMFTENDTKAPYIKDASGILAKVEYCKKGDNVNVKYAVVDAAGVTKALNEGISDKNFKKAVSDPAFNNGKAQSFDLNMTKFLNGSPLQDNNLKFTFWVRMISVAQDGTKTVVGGDKGKYGAVNTVTNNGSNINYPVDAAAWELQPGNTYYFVFGEKASDSASISCDKALIVAKVDYYTNGDGVEKTYYRIADEATVAPIHENFDSCVGLADLCTEANAIPENEAGFYNKSSMKIVVVKKWAQTSTDNIWDVNVKVKRRVKGGEFEDFEQFVISASECSEHDGQVRSTEHVIENVDSCDANGNTYEYVAEEYYNNGSELVKLTPISLVVYDAAGNVVEQASEAEDAVSTVNGYKLTESKTSYDEEGNAKIELTNTPYIKIKKVWTVNGSEVAYKDTEAFGSVFVNLYKSNGGSMELYKGPITLSYGGEWTAEVAVPDAGKYHIVECDSTGETEYRDAPKITYFSYSKDTQIASGTDWQSVFTEGSNAMLVVANERSGNVLPNSGGIGELPILIAGLGTAVSALLGGTAYRIKRKKEESEE
ncbi:MAG: hypothetical protein J5802_05565 [Butyrivibrio sp.]|nr:hypothetical protein [Butyrivibrio sp.]